MKKKMVLLLIIILLIILVSVVCSFIYSKTVYNEYVFIDYNRYNMCNFNYPKQWKVLIEPYALPEENSNGSTSQNLYIYIDNTYQNYITVGKEQSVGRFQNFFNDNSNEYVGEDLKIFFTEFAKSFKLKEPIYKDKEIKTIYYKDGNGDYGQYFVEINMDKNIYLKNKNEINRFIKYVQFNF